MKKVYRYKLLERKMVVFFLCYYSKIKYHANVTPAPSVPRQLRYYDVQCHVNFVISQVTNVTDDGNGSEVLDLTCHF